MKFFLEKAIPIIFISGFLFLGLFAGYEYRTLNNEAGAWLFDIINRFEYVYDLNFLRYTELFWQYYPLKILQLSNGNLVGLAVEVFSFALALHPVFSFIAVWLILKNKNKLHYISFFIFGFLTITYSTLFFTAGVAITALTFAWPLAALVLFFNPANKKELAWVFILITLLMFTHETALFYLMSLGLIFLFSMYHGKNNKFWHLFFSIYSFIGVTAYIVRLYNFKNSNSMNNFLNQAYFSPHVFRVVTYIWLSLFLLIALAYLFKKFSLLKITTSLVVGLGAVYYYFSRHHILNMPMSDSYIGRIFALPLLAAFIFILYFYFNCIDVNKLKNFKNNVILLNLILMPLCFWHDFNTTINWKKSLNAYKEISESKINEKCISISYSELNMENIDGIALGYPLSIVWQKTLNPEYISVLYNKNQGIDEICEVLDKKQIRINIDSGIYLRSININFDKITENWR